MDQKKEQYAVKKKFVEPSSWGKPEVLISPDRQNQIPIEKKIEQKSIEDLKTKQVESEIQKTVESVRPLADDHLQSLQELRQLDRANQVEALVRYAEQKSVPEAIALAEKLDNAYALDKLHDTLVKDDLYKRLTETGKLKKI